MDSIFEKSFSFQTNSDQLINLDSIALSINEEFSNFNKIINSICILKENNILLESESNSFLQKIINILKRIKDFFIKVGKAIINFFKKIKYKVQTAIIKKKIDLTTKEYKEAYEKFIKKYDTDPFSFEYSNNKSLYVAGDAETIKLFNLVQSISDRNDKYKEKLQELASKYTNSIRQESVIITEVEKQKYIGSMPKSEFRKLNYIDIDIDIKGTGELIKYYDKILDGLEQALDCIQKYADDPEGADKISTDLASGIIDIYVNGKVPSYFNYNITLKSSSEQLNSKLFSHNFFYDVLMKLSDYLSKTDELLDVINIDKINTMIDKISKAADKLTQQAKENDYREARDKFGIGAIKNFSDITYKAKNTIIYLKNYIDQIMNARRLLLEAISLHEANMETIKKYIKEG